MHRMTKAIRSRRDLAAMLVPLGRALMAAERPVLDAHGLTMWGYVVLDGLYELHGPDQQPTRSQAALAEAIGGDKTRLIPVLDKLQQRGLISRERDPADRRVHLLSLTDAGRALHDEVQQQIQRNEAQLLDRLPVREQQRFLNAVRVLADHPERDLGPATN
jgi:DNA-binding MarR family transcriptional regulator